MNLIFQRGIFILNVFLVERKAIDANEIKSDESPKNFEKKGIERAHAQFSPCTHLRD